MLYTQLNNVCFAKYFICQENSRKLVLNKNYYNANYCMGFCVVNKTYNTFWKFLLLLMKPNLGVKSFADSRKWLIN